MVSVGVAQLKAKLSEYLARVRAGEEVLITDHGRPVARIVAAKDEEDQHQADLERRGLIKRGAGVMPDGFFDMPRPTLADGFTLSEAVIEERREGR